MLACASKQTSPCHSRVNELTKCVMCEALRYFHWFLSKSTLKFDNRILFYLRHTLVRHVKAPHTLVHPHPTNILAKFRENTLLIHLNRGNSHKNKPRVFILEIFSQFSHLTKAAVIVVVLPTSEMPHRTP